MACKRPFHEVESYEIAPKQQRQQEPLTQPSSFLETFLYENGSHNLISGEPANNFSQCQVGRLAAEETGDGYSNVAGIAYGASSGKTAENTDHDYSSAVNSEAGFGEAESNSGQCQVGGFGAKEITDEYSNGAAAEYDDSSLKTAKDTVLDNSNAVNSETKFGNSSNDSSCLWVKSDAFEGYEDANESVHKPVFPHIIELDLQEFCSTPTEHPSQKMVPVGPEFQADIPDWDPQSLSNYSSEQSESGICIISIPDVESSVFTTYIGIENEAGCSCLDKGSIRCVRQHVKESRDNLSRSIGQDKFEELGFCEMGEVVAERWSKEEEQIFRDVVFSNKVSCRKNYWHALAISFPSKSNMELVSYYFNVFKLQQRAEQNRLDPMNIDSDDDEWQGFEARTMEEDVESLAGQDTLVHDQTTHEKEILGDTENGISEGASQEHLKLNPEELEGKFDDVFPILTKATNNANPQDSRDESCRLCECQCVKLDPPSVPVDAETDAGKASLE